MKRCKFSQEIWNIKIIMLKILNLKNIIKALTEIFEFLNKITYNPEVVFDSR